MWTSIDVNHECFDCIFALCLMCISMTLQADFDLLESVRDGNQDYRPPISINVAAIRQTLAASALSCTVQVC